jgi:hypothetical protein
MESLGIWLALVAIPLTGAAQERITGRVIDAGTGEMVLYVTVSVKDKYIGTIYL